MSPLSRRRFLATVSALAAAYQLAPSTVGDALAAPVAPSSAPSTLQQTILRAPARDNGSYHVLTAGPGEPYLPRLDVLGAAPGAGRAAARRSLLYLGHLSDLHVMDAQSPARIEPMIAQDHAQWAGAFHPQEPLTVQVVAAMVRAVADLRYSPVTGAALGAVVVTGDSADMHSDLELRWYIDVLDGVPVTPDSGRPGTYEGVQAWPEASWAYRPDDPAGGEFAVHGFPARPGLLERAVAGPVESGGLPAPWFAVAGNHDVLLLGTFEISAAFRALATGTRKAYDWTAVAAHALGGYAAQAGALQRFADTLALQVGLAPGFRTVTGDARRRVFEQHEFMTAHFATTPTPGPVGHGFTQANLDTGQTWWSAELSPQVRALGLDTCNQVAGPDGALPDDQFRWLGAELARAEAESKLVVVLSHHNSLTMGNQAQRPGADAVLHDADDVIDLLLDHPVAIAWLNGHTHLNQILAHPRTGDDGRGGFWEITTASCIDFPQQQQMVELVDNRDGTLSLFTTVVDHASPPTPGPGAGVADLAATSRELAANDWIAGPLTRRGSLLDRNTELLLPAPFDLSRISDQALAAQQAQARARMLAHDGSPR